MIRKQAVRKPFIDLAGNGGTTMRDMLKTRVKYESNVVGFRPRNATGLSKKAGLPKKHDRNVSSSNIYELLDLSRYEQRDDSPNASLDFQPDTPDDFRRRMRVNIVAMIFLVALAGLAAVDVLKLERAQLPSAATIVARSDLS